MSHPLRANLEIHSRRRSEWVRCSKCQRKHCPAGKDWRQFCKVRFLPPTKAGGLMADLNGQYLLATVFTVPPARCYWIPISSRRI